MQIVPQIDYERAPSEVQRAHDEHLRRHGRVTNMKRTLLHSVPAFHAYMEWYTLAAEIECFIGQRGVYREVVPPERVVNTESWEDWDPGEVLVTTVLNERGDKTALTVTQLYPSREVRDMLLEAGMTDGAAQTYDKLAELLDHLRGSRSG